MFNNIGEYNILTIDTDEDENGMLDTYTVTFDTRPYIQSENKYILNDQYLSFRLYKNNNYQTSQTITNIYGDNAANIFTIPGQFEYPLSLSSNENDKSIYFIEESLETQITDELSGAIDVNKDNIYEIQSQSTFISS